MLGVCGNFHQGFGGGAKEYAVNDPLVLEGQGSDYQHAAYGLSSCEAATLRASFDAVQSSRNSLWVRLGTTDANDRTAAQGVAMQNGREMQSTELEVRRRSEGYGCCRSSRSVSSTAAKRLSSTSFMIGKRGRVRRRRIHA